MNRILRSTVRRCQRSRVAVACATLALLALSLAAPQALAAAPAATTGSAQQVQFDTATVTGTVNPNGSATSYYFEYGHTAAYGLRTSAAPAGAGTGNVAVRQALSGLDASTAYHYRLVTVSAAGTVVGADATFTTSAPPAPTVATGGASDVSAATATLDGAVDPRGVATSYYFQYGTTTRYGHDTAERSAGSGTSSTAVSEALGGLAADTTYQYRLVAVSAGGTVAGANRTLTTTRTPAPTALTGAASAVGTTTATLNASIDAHGVATRYYFQYGTKTFTTRTAVTLAGAGLTSAPVSATLTGLTPFTTYVYRLVAVGASTSIGATRSFRTAKIPPGLSLASAADPVGAGSSVTFSATLSGTDVGVRSVALEIESYPYTGGFQQLGAAVRASPSGTVSFTVPDLTTDTMVRAVTLDGSPSLTSSTILEQPFVRLSTHVHRHGRSLRFFGLLAPGGAPVHIHVQRRVRGRWVNVARTTTSPISGGLASFSCTVHGAHRGRYRVLAVVLDGSLLSGRSGVFVMG